MADSTECAGPTSGSSPPGAAISPTGSADSDRMGAAIGWLGRLRERYEESLWGPIALKAGGLGFLMLALAGVGAASIATGVERGTNVPMDVPLVNQIGSVWLKTVTSTRPAPATGAPATGALSAAPAGSASAAPPPPAPPARSPGVTSDGKVILNQAGIEDLMKLPSIGRKRAEAILALRTRLGRFKRPTDLLRVRGLGPKRLRQLLPKVVVDAPPDPADSKQQTQ